MIGETISHYRIVGKIGAGGMGEVYRAHDPRIGREVAIKVLPAAVIKNAERLARFEREARAAGALNHPNVLAIYELGRHDEMPFIVSELLEGETLRQRLRAGDVTPRKAVDYAIQVAEGLAAAHAKGIVHRDLKPENIFVTSDGHVKILDFGLAKLKEVDKLVSGMSSVVTPSVQTEVGTVLGTLGYMSPEQLKGETADHRSDIFTFGAVLFEMLAGKKAFAGDSKAHVVAAILRDDPPSISSLARPVPPALEEIVRRCLEKRPDDRFHSAHDLGLALNAVEQSADWSSSVIRVKTPGRWLGFASATVAIAAAALALWFWSPFGADETTTAARGGLSVTADSQLGRRIGLLPFEANDDSQDTRALAAGLGESLAAAFRSFELQTGGKLWAISRWEVRRWVVDTPGDLWQLYGATHGIAARVEQSSAPATVHTRLVSLPRGKARRSARVLIEDGDRCRIQRELMAQVSTLLDFEPNPATNAALDGLVASSPEACAASLRGVGLLVIGSSEGELEAATGALQEAVDLDPDHWPSWAWLAEAWRRSSTSGGGADALEHGLAASKKALALAPERPEPYIAMAALHRAAGEPETALDSLERHDRNAARHSALHFELGRAYAAVGRNEEAEGAFQRAIRLRPGFAKYHNELGRLFWKRDKRDAAANQWRRIIDIAPENYVAYGNLGGAYLGLERIAEARQMFERSLEIEPTYGPYSNLGWIAFQESNYGEAAAMFERALEIDARHYLVWGNLGHCYHWMKQPADARPNYEKAIELGEQQLQATPFDPDLLADLASYHGLIGDLDRGLELIARVINIEGTNPEQMAEIGEAFEDLGERHRAMEWIERALEGGLEPEWILRSPTLREDECFRRLAEGGELGG